MRVVLDASAIAKLFFPEPGSEEVEKLLKEEVWAPSLVAYEVGNVFWKRVARGELSPDKAREGWTIFKKLYKMLKVKDVDCFETALKCNITCYDASYVALVEEINAKLLTFDTKLKRSLELCGMSGLLL